MTPPELGELTRQVETMEAPEARALRFRQSSFHFRIYRLAGSATLLAIIEPLWLQISPYFHVLRGSGNWSLGKCRASRDAGGTGEGRWAVRRGRAPPGYSRCRDYIGRPTRWNGETRRLIP
jgi:hypothetical protein